jgi:hypothetical protein
MEGLDAMSEIEIISHLSRSLEKEKSGIDTALYSSFGAFGTEASSEALVKKIKAARKFKPKTNLH